LILSTPQNFWVVVWGSLSSKASSGHTAVTSRS
jgi:hypothetical protein